MGAMFGRFGGLAVAAALLAGLAGCDASRPPLDADCQEPMGTLVVDEQYGFSICLPQNWRDMRAGDPAWVELYDEPNSEVEQNVANGSLVRFVVPLRPLDADRVVNLAAYTEEHALDWSVDEYAADYLRQLGETGAAGLVSEVVDLPAGRAVELTGTAPNNQSDPPGTDFVDAFVIATPETVFYLVFSSDRSSRSTYEDRFQEYASTFALLAGGAQETMPAP
jgi:hypothetical protein